MQSKKHEITFYIPSQQVRVIGTAEYVGAKIAGGFTRTEAQGGWIATESSEKFCEGDVVREPITLISINYGVEQFRALSELWDEIVSNLWDLGEVCVATKVDGELYLRANPRYEE